VKQTREEQTRRESYMIINVNSRNNTFSVKSPEEAATLVNGLLNSGNAVAEDRITISFVDDSNGVVVVATHPAVDFDAVVSIFLLTQYVLRGKRVVYKFVGVNDELDTGDMEGYCVDVTPKKIKGSVTLLDHHHNTALCPSNARLVFETFKDKIPETVWPLVDYADLVDTGRITYPETSADWSYLDMFNDIQAVLSADQSIIEFMSQALAKGRVPRCQKEQNMSDFIKESVMSHTVNGFRIAVVKTTQVKHGVHKYLFRQGFDIVILKDGNCAGVHRNHNVSQLFDMKMLNAYIDEQGWFYHSDGSFAARGTKKSPVLTPSRYSLDDLLDMTRRMLVDNNVTSRS